MPPHNHAGGVRDFPQPPASEGGPEQARSPTRAPGLDQATGARRLGHNSGTNCVSSQPATSATMARMATALLPSGEQIELRRGDQHAVIVEVGGALRSYRSADWEVVD